MHPSCWHCVKQRNRSISPSTFPPPSSGSHLIPVRSPASCSAVTVCLCAIIQMFKTSQRLSELLLKKFWQFLKTSSPRPASCLSCWLHITDSTVTQLSTVEQQREHLYTDVQLHLYKTSFYRKLFSWCIAEFSIFTNPQCPIQYFTFEINEIYRGAAMMRISFCCVFSLNDGATWLSIFSLPRGDVLVFCSLSIKRHFTSQHVQIIY